MTGFHWLLVLATLLCAWVAGFLFAFTAVIMPGIRRLEDGEFIRAFQAIDGEIQQNQPAFVFVWIGSVLALLAAAVAGLWLLRGADLALLIGAALGYLLGVQLPTFGIHLPLNCLQALELETMDAAARKRARSEFEPRWNGWNAFRTACGCLVSLSLMVLLVTA